MTTQKKKTTRRKQYRNMSVTELVAARKELVEKMEQIDAILNKAVEAVGAVRASAPRSRTVSDPAFQPIGTFNAGAHPAAQVALGTEAPIMAPRPQNAPNQDSGFSIFDADAFARQQAAVEEQYLAQNPGTPVPADYDFNSEEVTSEIDSLKQQIQQEMKNEGATETDT